MPYPLLNTTSTQANNILHPGLFLDRFAEYKEDQRNPWQFNQEAQSAHIDKAIAKSAALNQAGVLTDWQAFLEALPEPKRQWKQTRGPGVSHR